MENLRKYILFLIAVILSFPVYAINKCTDERGKVSFQDKPCAANQLSETKNLKRNRDSDDVNNVEPIYITIPGVGNAVLLSYKWWNHRIIQPDPSIPPTVKMISVEGEEPISFSITFIPNKEGKKISFEESSGTVYKIASRYVSGSVEKEVKLRKLETTLGPAIIASFNDEKYLNKPVPNGEYSSITVGQAAHSEIVVGFTILTNGTDSKALSEAFNIIGSFQVVARK